MRFTRRGRRQTPTIIIVALIDILIVLLIFLIVTTTFKQQPGVKLVLPTSKQSQQGSAENIPLQVFVDKQEPYLYLAKDKPVTLDKLLEVLKNNVASNPELQLNIRSDENAPFGQIINVMDAAKEAGVKHVNAVTRPPKAK